MRELLTTMPDKLPELTAVGWRSRRGRERVAPIELSAAQMVIGFAVNAAIVARVFRGAL